jgi:hypothetical protein
MGPGVVVTDDAMDDEAASPMTSVTDDARETCEGLTQSAPTPPRAGVRGGRSGSAAPRAESALSAPSTGTPLRSDGGADVRAERRLGLTDSVIGRLIIAPHQDDCEHNKRADDCTQGNDFKGRHNDDVL